MTRAISSYPTGRAGCGLAVLRLALVADLAGVATLTSRATTIPIAALGALATMITTGCLTRPTAILVMACCAASLATHAGQDPLLLAGAILAAAALALLGGGAYSVDARLFGRRVVTIASRPAMARPGDGGAPRSGLSRPSANGDKPVQGSIEVRKPPPG